MSFLERAAEVYPQRTAVVHGPLRRTWAQIYERCRRLASALQRAGLGKGDTVAVMLPNTPPMVEAHFGVPMAGAVLNALNTRLDPEAIAFMLDHGEAKAVIVDPEFAAVMQKAIALRQSSRAAAGDRRRGRALHRRRRSASAAPPTRPSCAGGDPAFAWELPADEWDAIALNYTSGTTGNPKGVVYHHRGAAINAISNILEWDMPKHPVYLWTLPMFHCNGWCFPWTVAARAGVNVCLRKVEARAMADAIREHGVTHYCGAPIVHGMLVNAPDETEAGPAARRQGDGGRRGAAGLADRGHGDAGLRPDPRLRPDRGLRAGHGLRQARGVGRPGHRRAGPAECAPGRALPPAAQRARARPADDAAGAAGTARPWARSCSAATSP